MKGILIFLVGTLVGTGGYHWFSWLNGVGNTAVSQPIPPSTALSISLETTNSPARQTQSPQWQKALTQQRMLIANLQRQLESVKAPENRIQQPWDDAFFDAQTRFDCQNLDYDWAGDMEMNFMNRLHDYREAQSDGQKLTQQKYKFTCRTSMCELRLMDPDSELWNNIFVELEQQDWWQWDSSYLYRYLFDDQSHGEVAMETYVFEL